MSPSKGITGTHVFYGGKLHAAADLADCSRQFREYLDSNGMGASDMRRADGDIYVDGKKAGHVSYNGRVWGADGVEVKTSPQAEPGGVNYNGHYPGDDDYYDSDPDSDIGTKTGAELMHSDDDLGNVLEPAAQAPQAGPSNDELVENSHAENGLSPVYDGEMKSPERQNVNAIREAIETQAEMEVGKPIEQKQKEVAVAEEAAAEKAMHPGATEVSAKPGTQIIINVASWDYPTKRRVFAKYARFFTIDELKKAGKEYLDKIRTAAIAVSQGDGATIIDMAGRQYALYGQDGEAFRSEYDAIQKPEAKVNALVEKYMWKLQPYGAGTRSFPEPRPKAQQPAPAAPQQQEPDIEGWLKKQEQPAAVPAGAAGAAGHRRVAQEEGAGGEEAQPLARPDPQVVRVHRADRRRGRQQDHVRPRRRHVRRHRP